MYREISYIVQCCRGFTAIVISFNFFLCVFSTLAKYMISYLHLDQSLPRLITSINTFSSFKLNVN